MAIVVCPVTPSFAAEIGDVDLSTPLAPPDVQAIRDAFTQYAVLIFPAQRLSHDQHLDFARLFGPLETTIAVFRKDARLRLREEFADVSNLDPDNKIWAKDSRQRWRVHDLVIWDNRCTMHRGTACEDLRWTRDMQRATVSDIANTCEQEGIAVDAA